MMADDDGPSVAAADAAAAATSSTGDSAAAAGAARVATSEHRSPSLRQSSPSPPPPEPGSSSDRRRSPSFGEAFAPLAHHLFPDGPPRDYSSASSSSPPSASSSPLLSECWPPRRDRLPVSPASARGSLGALRRAVVALGGLRRGEMLALSIAACATLPRRRRSVPVAGDAVVVAGEGSPLVDGTTRVFVEIVRLMIPSPASSSPASGSSSSAEEGADREEEEDAVPAEVVRMLLSAAPGRCDAGGKRVVLRFLTLAVRSGCLRRRATPPQLGSRSVLGTGGRRGGRGGDGARRVLSSLYSVPFSMLDDPETVGDAVRLLHAVTRRGHARPHRASRVRRIYDGAGAASATTPGGGGGGGGGVKFGPGEFAPLVLLLQLYARYDPTGCGRYFPREVCLGGSFSRYFRFPDEAWDREFMSSFRCRSGSTSQVSGRDAVVPSTEHARQLVSNKRGAAETGGGDDGRGSSSRRPDAPAAKRPRRDVGGGGGGSSSSSASASTFSFDGDALIRTIDRLEDAFDGVGSSSWALLPGGDGDGPASSSRAVRASDLLADESLRHLILLSSDADGVGIAAGASGSGGVGGGAGIDVCNTEVARLRACLPHMLYDEWYEEDGGGDGDAEEDGDASILGSSGRRCSMRQQERHGRRRRRNRVRVMRALSAFASHADALPPEAEAFVLEEVLPNWDGGEDEIGDVLCSGLLPALSPATFPDLERRVLRHLGKLYVIGSPRLKHLIISGGLAPLVRRWGRLGWPKAATAEGDPSRFGGRTTPSKIPTLNELVHWTDNLLLTGLIAEGGSDGGGHELVRLSALDFLEAVCGLSEHCENFVFSPSAALVYRLLLSSTALCIDRVCSLLLRYKDAFEDLKKRKDSRTCNVRDAGLQGGNLLTEFGGLERCVNYFNCFIWDYCSVLWRCSPLPSAEGDVGGDDMSHINSILFTDLPKGTLQELRFLPGDLKVASALSITHGAVFSGFASDFLKEQRNAGKLVSLEDAQALTPDLLTGTMKAKYLDHLRDLGFVGIFEFLTTFVGSLSDREAKRARKRQEKRKHKQL